jgi:hypothetical protein
MLELEEFKELTSKLAQEGDDILCALRKASLLFFFYYSYVHTRLGSFLHPAPTQSLTTHSAPSLSPHPLNTQQKLFCPYF